MDTKTSNIFKEITGDLEPLNEFCLRVLEYTMDNSAFSKIYIWKYPSQTIWLDFVKRYTLL